MNPETLQEQHSKAQWDPADADKPSAIPQTASHPLDVLRHCDFLSLVCGEMEGAYQSFSQFYCVVYSETGYGPV